MKKVLSLGVACLLFQTFEANGSLFEQGNKNQPTFVDPFEDPPIDLENISAYNSSEDGNTKIQEFRKILDNNKYYPENTTKSIIYFYKKFSYLKDNDPLKAFLEKLNFNEDDIIINQELDIKASTVLSWAYPKLPKDPADDNAWKKMQKVVNGKEPWNVKCTQNDGILYNFMFLLLNQKPFFCNPEEMAEDLKSTHGDKAEKIVQFTYLLFSGDWRLSEDFFKTGAGSHKEFFKTSVVYPFYYKGDKIHSWSYYDWRNICSIFSDITKNSDLLNYEFYQKYFDSAQTVTQEEFERFKEEGLEVFEKRAKNVQSNHDLYKKYHEQKTEFPNDVEIIRKQSKLT